MNYESLMTTQHDPIKKYFDVQSKALDGSVNARLNQIREETVYSRTVKSWLIPAIVAGGAAIFMTSQSYAIEPLPLVDEAEFELMLSDEPIFVVIRDDVIEIETNTDPTLTEHGENREDGEKP